MAAHEDVANLLLRASWCLRIDGRSGDTVAASRYRTDAISEFMKALAANQGTVAENRRSWIYLVAEISRREGDFAAAALWFGKFFDDPPAERDWVEAAKTLLLRADAGDASNIGFEEILGQA